MYFPDEATAPAVGCSRYTRSASTFCRKMKIVSSAKLPAPSVARPMMRMMPPAPEPGLIFSVRLTFVTVVVNTVSVCLM